MHVEKVLNLKCFDFLYNFCCHIFLLTRREHTNIFIALHVSVCQKGAENLSDCYKIWIFWQIFDRFSNIKFNENPSTRRPCLLSVQTDDRQANLFAMLGTRLRRKCVKYICKIHTQNDTVWPSCKSKEINCLFLVNGSGRKGRERNVIVCELIALWGNGW